MSSIVGYINELHELEKLSKPSRDRLLAMIEAREEIIEEAHQIILTSHTVTVLTADYYYKNSTAWLGKSGYSKL